MAISKKTISLDGKTHKLEIDDTNVITVQRGGQTFFKWGEDGRLRKSKEEAMRDGFFALLMDEFGIYGTDFFMEYGEQFMDTDFALDEGTWGDWWGSDDSDDDTHEIPGDDDNDDDIPDGGGSGCFQAGTQIHLDNNVTKSIELIKVGDTVRTANLDSKNSTSTVTQIFQHEKNTSGLILNGKIKTTDNHPFYSNGAWIDAGSLKLGDEIVHIDGKQKVTHIEKIKNPTTVFNFEVDGTHNYFADGFLVHNKVPTPPYFPLVNISNLSLLLPTTNLV